MTNKAAPINVVAKDRLWRDYVSREENHQTYWAVEAQFVKGSLSPDKKHILRNVEPLGEFDATILLGTTAGGNTNNNPTPTSPNSPSSATGSLRSRRGVNGGNTITTSANPNSPSNLLLRQLQMTAAENHQAEEKQLEQLQQFKHNYSTRAGLQHKEEMQQQQRSNKDDPSAATEFGEGSLPRVSSQRAVDGSLSPNSNRQTPVPLNSNGSGSPRYPMPAKEKTLNNSYCSFYAGKQIGIHHYNYSPPSRSCQTGPANTNMINSAHLDNSQHIPNAMTLESSANSPNSTIGNAHAKPALPPLSLGLTRTAGTATSGSQIGFGGTMTARAYNSELEAEAALVSPKRHYTEHGLLQPAMGRRVANTTGQSGYGQRIASSHEVAFAVRPSVELNERSQHGYRKW